MSGDAARIGLRVGEKFFIGFLIGATRDARGILESFRMGFQVGPLFLGMSVGA